MAFGECLFVKNSWCLYFDIIKLKSPNKSNGHYKTDTCSSPSSPNCSSFGNGVSIVLDKKDWLYCEHQLLQLEVGLSFFKVPGGVFSPTFLRTGVFGLSNLAASGNVSKSLLVDSSQAKGAGSGSGVP